MTKKPCYVVKEIHPYYILLEPRRPSTNNNYCWIKMSPKMIRPRDRKTLVIGNILTVKMGKLGKSARKWTLFEIREANRKAEQLQKLFEE